MNLFQALTQAFRIPELRRKLVLTGLLLLIFRILSAISIPGASQAALSALFNGKTILGLLNLFSGGGLARLNVVALGLNPYINATIIMQLMTVVSVRLKELSKEGEIGRKKITRYTRWLTVPLAAMQAFAYTAILTDPNAVQVNGVSQAVIPHPTPVIIFGIVLTWVAGTVIAMWLGELITEYGVGNGVSMIIFVGIIGRFPGSVISYATGGGFANVARLAIMAFIALLVTAAIIEMQQAQRKIPVQSAQRVVNPRGGAATQARRNFLPLRVTTAGVIPIIFAISIMTLPTIVTRFLTGLGGTANNLATWITNNWQPDGPSILMNLLYNGFYFLLVLGFTYFYTAVLFDPQEVAENFKKSSTFIAGFRPGRQTAEYLGRVMGRLTLAGGLFLAFITVVLPLATGRITGIGTSSLYLGGTAILIVVGVSLDTMKQIETQLLMRQYRGFIR